MNKILRFDNVGEIGHCLGEVFGDLQPLIFLKNVKMFCQFLGYGSKTFLGATKAIL